MFLQPLQVDKLSLSASKDQGISMFEFIVLTVDLMKHLKAFCRIGRNRSGDLRSLFRRFFSFFLRVKVIKFRKFLPFNEIFEIFMSSLSKRIFFRCWVLFVSQYT